MIGGASEIAESLLALLAGRGLRQAVLCGRDEAALRQVARRLELLGVAQVDTLSCDVQEVSGLGPLAEHAAALLGRVDLVVVAAGMLLPTGREELDPEMVARLVGTNFTGPAAAVAAFVPVLRRQRAGRVVVLSSVAGVRVRRANLLYGAAKAGLDAFGQGLAATLTGTGVGVLIVRPGFVRTRMTAGRRPQPLAVGPERVAEAIVAGLERGAAVVWVPGVLRPVFALARLVPRRAWARLTR